MTDTNAQVDEIASGIYRLSTLTEAIPGGFTFNQFLVVGEDALLFHTGLHHLFPAVSEAAARVVPHERIRWISFGHREADESGAMNDWLEAAPAAEVAVGSIGAMLSGNDQAARPPRALGNGDVVDLGGKRLRWIDTPHVPHGWDAGLLYEETTGTLLCGDLFTHAGAGPAVTDGDILGPAIVLEDMMHATCLTPATPRTIRRLAQLQPTTLALMHGSSFSGDGGTALSALADEYQARLGQILAGGDCP